MLPMTPKQRNDGNKKEDIMEHHIGKVTLCENSAGLKHTLKVAKASEAMSNAESSTYVKNL